jgi:SWI/SNF-related matrix-associated actin-dependent regulator 1 of chromatin subfamily A
MVRRLKADVLKELPAKRRQVIALQPQDAATRALIERENAIHARVQAARAAVHASKASSDPSDYARAIGELEAAEAVAFEEISRVRHEVALAKLPQVIEHLEMVLESEAKVVLMGWHRDVLNAIEAHFATTTGVAKITGETPVPARQGEVDRFQNDPKCRLFVGSIKAAGVGITLTASSMVVFCELDVVPGNLSQAEDRCHRIGQHDSVLVQHVVLEGSYDMRMAEIVIEKQAIFEAGLADRGADTALKAPPVIEAHQAPQPVVQAPPPTGVENMTPDQIAAVHEALKRLAGVCDGAFQLDGQGFNRLDASFGHDLAARSSLTLRQAAAGRRLAIKYQRQLGPELLATIRGEVR